MVIWKYVLPQYATEHTFEVPQGSRFVSAGEQGGNLCLWAEVVDPEVFKVPAKVWVMATGVEYPMDLRTSTTARLVDRISLLDGKLIFHVYAEQP